MKTSHFAPILALAGILAGIAAPVLVASGSEARRAQLAAAAEQETAPTSKAYAVNVEGLRADRATVPVDHAAILARATSRERAIARAVLADFAPVVRPVESLADALNHQADIRRGSLLGGAL